MFNWLSWIQHVAANWIGARNLAGSIYGFWSGWFGDLTILSLPVLYWRHKNCHAKGCPRLGRHKVDGTEFTVCRKHHPEDHKTVDDIHAAWREAKEKNL